MNYVIENENINIESHEIDFILPFFHTEKLILKNKEYTIEKLDPKPSAWILTREGKAYGVREV